MPTMPPIEIVGILHRSQSITDGLVVLLLLVCGKVREAKGRYEIK